MDQQKDEFDLAADLLSIWREFPFDKAAFTATLREICHYKPERADWLVSQRDQFDKYPGPATLRDMITTHFNPTGPNAKYQSPAPPPSFNNKLCKLCQGWGCIEVSGVWQHCNCRDGFDLKARVPGYVEFCNSLKSKPKTDGLRHVSETIANVIAGKQTQANRIHQMREPGED